MPRKQQHVVTCQNGWAVKEGDNKHASSVHPTQAEAIRAGRKTAVNQRGELFVYGEDGQILQRSIYGIDPYPSKG